MSHLLFTDKRASNLLSRVSEDLCQLRSDVGNLLSHTTRHTLPEGANEIAGLAKQRLAAGTNYAASQLRSLRQTQVTPASGAIAGVALLGLIGLGIYTLCKYKGCCESQDVAPEDEAV